MAWKLPVLVAFPYANSRMMALLREHAGKIRLLVDCGAFTAYKAGKPVVLSEYIEFVQGLQEEGFEFEYVHLDVVGNHEQTRENYRTMLGEGLSPCPVYQMGDSEATLRWYFDSAEKVFVGGIHRQGSTEGHLQWLYGRFPDKAFHWFGHYNREHVARYRPVSVDTSNHAAGARFAQLRLYLGRGRFVDITRRSVQSHPLPFLRWAVRRIGFGDEQVQALKTAEGWKGGFCKDQKFDGLRGAAALMHSVCFILNAHEVERAYGTTYFLAIAADSCFHRTMIALRHAQDQGLLED